MDALDITRLDLAQEFMEKPTGPFSGDLQKLLKIMRWRPLSGRTVAVQPQRNGRWYLATLPDERIGTIAIDKSRGYANFADAQRAIFAARWAEAGGPTLDVPEADPTQFAADDTMVSDRPLAGYPDRFSVPAGEKVEFKISSSLPGSYSARLVHLQCGDAAGVGFKAHPVATTFEGNYTARHQAVELGSYVEIPATTAFCSPDITFQARIWPTLPATGTAQAIISRWDEAQQRGLVLEISGDGFLQLRIGDGSRSFTLQSPKKLLSRHWYEVAGGIDSSTGELWLVQHPQRVYAAPADTAAQAAAPLPFAPADTEHLRIAASLGGTTGVLHCYNGKIEAPAVLARSLSPAARQALCAAGGLDQEGAVAAWDFGQEINSLRVIDVAGHGHNGQVVNMPTRAMKGMEWDGSEYNWVHKPSHYAAIHFHEDDLYDCRWKTDFTFAIPGETPSGLYCVHLQQGEVEDYIPFVITPPKGTARADLALLLPTASYWAYANSHHALEMVETENYRGVFSTAEGVNLYLQVHREYGLSMYDSHRDGSGVCLSSRLRPIFTMRPAERLWQLPADTHITDWLTEKQIPFDVITEDDLEEQGAELLNRYRCVMTGTHPEYPSKRMMDAYEAYKAQGGRFIYMGGNGFYWRTSYHPEIPGVIEMRRGEDGIRTWLPEGGEYYHSLTGELGGMWRRMGAAPQSVAGVGMTAQGFDRSTYYLRTPASADARVSFIFEGIPEGEKIGDFGLIGGGAAGWEVDRADTALGTPPHALVVGTATTFTSAYNWMKEEMTHTHAATGGDVCPLVRSDLTFFETPNGGAAFSTGSIAWAGALSHNGYENNVSRLTENVVRRFLDPKPF